MKLIKDGYRILYDDVEGQSLYFETIIRIDLWSKKPLYWLETAGGMKISVTSSMLSKLNFKLVSENRMVINSPRRSDKRIPLLAIAGKLKKIWKGSIDIYGEYKNREKSGYYYWEPRTNG